MPILARISALVQQRKRELDSAAQSASERTTSKSSLLSTRLRMAYRSALFSWAKAAADLSWLGWSISFFSFVFGVIRN
jgi:Leu/Phe-tRNA-protein transferase